MRLLNGLRPHDRILEMIEFAVEGRVLVLPQRQDAGHRLVEHPQPLGNRRKRNPAHLEFRLSPSAAKSRNQPATAQMVQRHQALRCNRRMTEQIAKHEMTDADFFGRVDHRRRHHNMVKGLRLRVHLLVRTFVYEMVGKNNQVIAERLRGLSMRAILRRFQISKLNSEFHWYLARKRFVFGWATLANRSTLRTSNFVS